MHRQDIFGNVTHNKVPDAWAIMQASNLYVYCINNPIMFIDPSGEFILKSAIFAAAVAAFKAKVKAGTVVATRVVTKKVVTTMTRASGAVVTVTQKIVKNVDLIMEKANQIANWGGKVFRKLNVENFRHNLKVFTEVNSTYIQNKHAHHIFPKFLAKQFKAIGIDVNNPLFGSWVDKQHHQSFSHVYNQIWFDFLQTNPTKQQVFQKAIDLSQTFGFTLNF